jgi:cytochrome c oxidase accessory protein FixG
LAIPDNKQDFRDAPSTLNQEGKRRWMFPKMPSGKWHNYRLIVGYSILIIFSILPFIKYNGRPFMLIDIFSRKFILFGQVFWPQDIFILVIGLLTLFVSIIIFTVVYGRVFCGWTCPQTLFMELVFRKIEYWIEGDFRQQIKLNQMPWNSEKIKKKTFKHIVFILISVLFAHIVMAYLVGAEEVLVLISSNPLNNLSGFLGLSFFTLLFYLVFSQVREIVCTVICPYGRLQGVLLNRESMVVAYDYLRGEPRGKLKKSEPNQNKGDCVDCDLCVQVCPTGIDIRNGTQLECINCTACIDACNTVMEKISKPKGLIRFDSLEGIEKKIPFKFSPRLAAYSGVLLLLMSSFIFFTTTRTDLESTVMRIPGQLYQIQENGEVSNLFKVQIVNKTFDEKTVVLRLGNDFSGELRSVGGDGITIPAQGSEEAVFFVDCKPEKLEQMSTDFRIEIIENGEVISSEKSVFLGPLKN